MRAQLREIRQSRQRDELIEMRSHVRSQLSDSPCRERWHVLRDSRSSDGSVSLTHVEADGVADTVCGHLGHIVSATGEIGQLFDRPIERLVATSELRPAVVDIDIDIDTYLGVSDETPDRLRPIPPSSGHEGHLARAERRYRDIDAVEPRLDVANRTGEMRDDDVLRIANDPIASRADVFVDDAHLHVTPVADSRSHSVLGDFESDGDRFRVSIEHAGSRKRLIVEQHSMPEIDSRIAIVTGASGGIGRAAALRLAHDGFAVVVNYAGNPATAQAVCTEIVSSGGRARVTQADVASAPDVEHLFADTLDAFGRLDVVVYCAGIMPLAPIAGNDMALFDRVIATNLRGTFTVLAQAARHVRSGGRIIALSSSVVAKAFPTYGPYIASKAGLEGLVHVLANELRGRNVTVNAIAGGPVGTELFLRGKSQERIDELAKLAPLERLGQPDDIARIIAFLAGPDGAWVNAQVLQANGGFAFA